MSDGAAPSPPSPLRRIAFGVLAVAVGLVGVVLVLLWFQGKDSSQVTHDAPALAGPGSPAPADGGSLLRAGAIRADGGRLSRAELQRALRLGDVVVLYGAPRPPAALRTLVRKVAGGDSPELEASGQAIVLARPVGTRASRGVVALAWRRTVRAVDPQDPALESFADYWLGRGTGG